MKTKRQTTREPTYVEVEIGKTSKVQAKNGWVLDLNYLGVMRDMHVFHSGSGNNYFYAAKLWDMSPDHRYVRTNERGFIPVEKLYLKIDNPQLRDLVKEVRDLI